MDSKEKLIVDNMNLVYYVLHKFYPKRYLYDEDLVQCGMMGLCRRAETYGPEKGAFSTFAIRGIRNEITNELKRRRKYRDLISLSQKVVDDDSELTLEDTLPSDESVEFDNSDNMLSLLTPMEREVLKRRIDGETYKEIAEPLSISHETARQMCQRIKRKWRDYI